MTPRNLWAWLMGDRVTINLDRTPTLVAPIGSAPLIVVALTPEQAHAIEHVVPGISVLADVALDDAATGGSWG